MGTIGFLHTYYGTKEQKEWVYKAIIQPLGIDTKYTDHGFYKLIWETSGTYSYLGKIAHQYVKDAKFKESFNTLLNS